MKINIINRKIGKAINRNVGKPACTNGARSGSMAWRSYQQQSGA